MPKSKTNKKRKAKVVAYKENIKNRQKKFRTEFIKKLQEAHSKELEGQVNASKDENTEVEGLNEFSLDNVENQSVIDNSNELSEFSLDNIQVEQTAPDVNGNLG